MKAQELEDAECLFSGCLGTESQQEEEALLLE
jgi:hypothetical protein